MTITPNRRVFILLSTRAWPYAQHCVETMLGKSIQPIDLRLVVDDQDEQEKLQDLLKRFKSPARSSIEIVSKDDVRERLISQHPQKSGLLQLHDGHPCWRKIIDPLILSQSDEEIIVTDPDLYFPNGFAFEPTPTNGVMMMRQNPNCLFPPDAVRQAYAMGVQLANHVDIGVAQVRAGSIDLDWLDWFARGLDLPTYRPYMHIEAIIWSALAMKIGGEHLNPKAWKCWERGHLKRFAVAWGVPGRLTLKLEPLKQIKCIHVSGPSKWWVTEAIENGALTDGGKRWTEPVKGVPYCEITRDEFEKEQKMKRLARSLGYQRLTGG